MSVAERHLHSTLPADELDFVLEQVRVGNYADALQALARAKADDQRNIFLIALEKQVMRLRAGGVLPREKTEIIESLPGLVERARAGRQARADVSAHAPSESAPPASPAAAGERKDPRVKMVVEQYLRHADEWVKKRDFEAALKEIERVLLIEPDNRAAREYQSRVQALFRIEQHDAPAAGPSAESVLAPEEVVEQAAAGKKPGKTLLILVGGILLLVIVVSAVLFLRPRQGQYRVGYMYVSTAVQVADEAQVPATATEPESGATEVVESTPAVKPPDVAQSSEKQGTKSVAAKQLGTAKETPAEKATPPEKGSALVEEPPAEAVPTKAVPGTSSPVAPAPSAIAEKDRAQEEPAAASQFIPVEQPPRIVQLQQPNFSQEQIAQGIQGDVVVKVQIDKTGKPLQAKVISSTNASLNVAVIDAVMRSSYAPGVMSSGPVTTWMTIPLKLK